MNEYSAHSLLKFLDDSPCNFFAVNTIKRHLISNGFIELDACNEWKLKKGGKYFVDKIFAVNGKQIPRYSDSQ